MRTHNKLGNIDGHICATLDQFELYTIVDTDLGQDQQLLYSFSYQTEIYECSNQGLSSVAT